MMTALENILAEAERNHPSDDFDMIRRAYAFAEQGHEGQVRKSGEPYLSHPLAVARILAEMRLDAVCIAVVCTGAISTLP